MRLLRWPRFRLARRVLEISRLTVWGVSEPWVVGGVGILRLNTGAGFMGVMRHVVVWGHYMHDG